MKLRKDPLFILSSLLLCLPLGIFLLFSSEISRRKKNIFLSISLVFNACLIALLLYQAPLKPSEYDFNISIGQSALEVGESTSVSVCAEQKIQPSFQLTADNECIKINGSTITAQKIGKCNLTVSFAQETETIPITITSDHGKGKIVYTTQNSTRYHKSKAHCKKNILKMTAEEALQSGKSPCKNCY